MKRFTLLAFVSMTATVALFACSSDEEEEKFASSDAFCTAKADAECTKLAASCEATIDACKQKRTSTCIGEAAAAAGQGRSYRPSAAQPCIDKVNDVFKSGGVGVAPTAEQDLAKVCDRVFAGSKKVSEACASTSECEGELICDRSVCVKEEKVALKGQCNNAGQVCETGTYCQQQGVNKFCVERNGAGDSCGDDNPCLETFRCVNKCEPKVTVGNPCDKDSDCADEAPFCDLTSSPRKCRAKYRAGTTVCKEFGSTL